MPVDEFYPSRSQSLEDRIRHIENWASLFSGRRSEDPAVLESAAPYLVEVADSTTSGSGTPFVPELYVTTVPDSTTRNLVQATNTATVPLVIRLFSGSTQNLLEGQNAAGTTLTRWMSTGEVRAPLADIGDQQGQRNTTFGSSSMRFIVSGNTQTCTQGLMATANPAAADIFTCELQLGAYNAAWGDARRAASFGLSGNLSAAGALTNEVIYISDPEAGAKVAEWDRFGRFDLPLVSLRFGDYGSGFPEINPDAGVLFIRGRILAENSTINNILQFTDTAVASTAHFIRMTARLSGNLGLITVKNWANVTYVPIVGIGLTGQTGNLLNLYENNATGEGIVFAIDAAGDALFRRTTTTTVGRKVGEIAFVLSDTTDATRKGRGTLLATDATADREAMRWETDGSRAQIAFGGAVLSSTFVATLIPVNTFVGLVVRGAASQSAALQTWQDSSGNVLSSVGSAGAVLAGVRDAATNTIVTVLSVAHNTSGTPAAGYGSRQLWCLESSTTEDVDAAAFELSWVVATHGSRTARMQFYAYDTAARECIRMEASGSAPMLGFYGVAAVARPSAYTQTYATADKTHANPTAVTLTDNSGGTADTTLEAISAGYVQSEVANNFADLAASNNALIADVLDVKQLLNSVIDDLQSQGILQ